MLLLKAVSLNQLMGGFSYILLLFYFYFYLYTILYMNKKSIKKLFKRKTKKITKSNKKITKKNKILPKKRKGIYFGGNEDDYININEIISFTNPEIIRLIQEEKPLHYILPGTNNTLNEINKLKEEIEIEIEDEEAPFVYFDEAIEEYQDFSYKINGFLRENVIDYYSNKSISELFRMCGQDIPSSSNDKKMQITINKCIKQNIDNTMQIINTLDYIFENDACPTFKNKTVLFRGTEYPYEKESIDKTIIEKNSIINKGFLSTTKTLDNLFSMYKKGDKILSKNNKCCVNILIVNEGIPYLDLEVDESKWGYQQEILLPRDLELILLGEDKYLFETVEYKVYLYKVQLYNNNDNKYIPSKINLTFDLIELQKMVHLLTVQKESIYDLTNKIKKDNNNPNLTTINDKIENIELILDTYSLNVIKYVCTKQRYIVICNNIIEQLKKMNELVNENDLQTSEYESSYHNIISSIEDSMN